MPLLIAPWAHADPVPPEIIAPSPKVLTPAQQQEDVQFVFASIEQVHPDPYFYVDRADILQRKQALLDRLTTSATAADFYRDVQGFVGGYRDDHTEVVAPAGAAPVTPPVVHTYLWKFHVLPDRIGYLDFGYMTDRPNWQKFLARTFNQIKNDQLVGLIIDLRTNTGGDSQLGDDLLAYITDKPYHSLTSKAWRFSAPYVAQLHSVDPWGFASASPDQEPPVDFKALFQQRPPAAFRAALRDRAPPQTKRIVERWAPHWLDEGSPSPDEPETLTLKFTSATTPPADMPLRFHGPVVFLIGPQTFSSAVILANTVEDNQLAPLLGEETKPCNQFGEACSVQLPNSGLKLAIATAKFVRANGDANDHHGVRPTLVITPSQPTTDRARDPVVNRAQTYLHEMGSGRGQVSTF